MPRVARKRPSLARRHSLGSEAPVVVLLLRLRVRFGLGLRRLRGQHVDGILVRRVNVRLRCRDGHLDLVLVRTRLHNAEICRNLVVTLRTPGDITA